MPGPPAGNPARCADSPGAPAADPSAGGSEPPAGIAWPACRFWAALGLGLGLIVLTRLAIGGIL
jgi:hypothetical protein